MRRLVRIIVRLGALVGIVAVVAKAADWFKGDPDGVGGEGFTFAPDDVAADPYAIDPNSLGGEVNPELLSRLVCPLDKGPLDYVDGKWLVNRRNGYRYPITDGIPVMLIEVGERYRDPSMITADVAPANGAAAS